MMHINYNDIHWRAHFKRRTHTHTDDYNHNYFTQNTALVFRSAKIGHTVPVPNTHCRRTHRYAFAISLDVSSIPPACCLSLLLACIVAIFVNYQKVFYSLLHCESTHDLSAGRLLAWLDTCNTCWWLQVLKKFRDMQKLSTRLHVSIIIALAGRELMKIT